MKAILWTTVALSLLAVKAVEGVSSRRRSRKQEVPSRAPLSGNEGAPLSAAVLPAPPTGMSLPRVTRARFKPSIRMQMVVSPPSEGMHSEGDNFSRSDAKGKQVQMPDEIDVSGQGSSLDRSSGAPSSSSSAAYNEASSSAHHDVTEYKHETREQMDARRAEQAAIVEAKWKEMQVFSKDVQADKMADLIRSFSINGIPRKSATIVIGKLLIAEAGLDYKKQVMKALAVKARKESAVRFRERVKPAAQRRKYIRKAPLKKQGDQSMESSE